MRPKLSRTAYQEVEHRLRDRIRRGDWPVGAALPSCQTLASEYAVAVGTVHQAIRSMATAEIVRSVPGRGTFVIDSPTISDPIARAASSMRLAIVAGLRPPDTPSGTDVGISALVTSLERACGEFEATAAFYSRQMAGVDWEPFTTTVSRIDWEATEGVVLVGVAKNLETPDDLVKAARDAKKPVVCLTSVELPGIIPHVFYDNTFAGYQAGRHLIDKGFKKITFLAPFRSSWGRARATGLRQAVAEADLASNALAFYPAWDDAPSVDQLGRVTYRMTVDAVIEPCIKLIREQGAPEAIVAMNDAAAIGYIEAASQFGLKPGLDYVIVGFDNLEEARGCGLTSLQPPWEAMSEEAIRLLVATVRGQHVGTQIRVRPHLVARASTDRSHVEPAKSAIGAPAAL
ncbi:MAG: GntR family transcriptional regulator [Capsulimonadaceae bacterium]|nr:GntR family transcriptional regulator [Capsulimonadaceae bacterium]